MEIFLVSFPPEIDATSRREGEKGVEDGESVRTGIGCERAGSPERDRSPFDFRI